MVFEKFYILPKAHPVDKEQDIFFTVNVKSVNMQGQSALSSISRLVGLDFVFQFTRHIDIPSAFLFRPSN
jgi:hypothetical protein